MLLPLKSKTPITPNQQRTTNFLQNQSPALKYPYLVLLFLTISAAGLGIFAYFTADNAMIRWEKVSHLEPVDAIINQFTQAQQTFTIKANGYLLTERYDASLPYINVFAAHIFLAFLGVLLVYFLTVASTLKRWTFLAAMLLLMFFLVTATLEGLELIPGGRTFILLPVMLLLAGPAYTFQAFYPTVSFAKRLGIFALLVGLLGIFIFSRSPLSAELTSLHLISHVAPALLIASILFIVWVAYEIIHFLVWVNTQAQNPQRRHGMWQFMFIALIYLASLTIFFLNEAGVYDIDILQVNAFLILFLSALAGFWGLRKREEVYGGMVAFWPGAAFLFLIFASITFLNIGYVFATANDPLIAAYRSLIIYLHLGYGFMFFLYVMVNFGRLLGQKLQVYKVVYDPKRLPFFTVITMGSIATLFLFAKTQWFTYSQARAGFYNYLGDLYNVSGEELLAERFYRESDILEHHNVKANYSLAGISREKNFRNTEIVYLKEALRKRPSEKVYARLSALFEDKQYFFEQQFVLKEALQKFPESARLNNNMALHFNKTSLLDSTHYYYDLAENFSNEKELITSNKLAFYIKNGLPEQAQIVAKENAGTGYVPLKSNAVLLQHLMGQETPKPEYPAANTIFDTPAFTLLYHTVLNRLHTDSSAISHLKRYIQTKENAPHAEDFTLLKGALEQYHAQPLMAKATLENLSRTTSAGTGYYQDILGQWMLEQGLYAGAADYFSKAKSNGFPEAPIHEAWALAFAGKKAEAMEAARNLQTAENPETVKEAAHLLAILEADLPKAFTLKNEADKVKFLQIQPLSDQIDFTGLIASIQNETAKMAAENVLVSRLNKQNNLPAAQQFLQTRPTDPAAKTVEQSDRNRLQALVWARSKNVNALQQNQDKLYLEPQFAGEKIYYKALLAENSNKIKDAKTLYDRIEKVLPYHEDALLAASKFYRDKQKDDMEAYNILMAGITYNPFSAALYKAYVLQSLKAGFESYAAAGMEQLTPLLSPEEYATFNQLYQAELAKIQEISAGWE
ncbi:APC family permease [Adhaeribacter sp. BT258]|uniref:APC family permease n=1 Tax=Adhaeribacter terrigena TaxID=2793070 RepID=A0ABS1BXW8_9BACT|nr:APC family permease [Adhaeribacter terrigena]MBK0401997.1 APC family permease [Adhaeribacter terrigena]